MVYFPQLPHHTQVFIRILQKSNHTLCSGMLELLRQWYLHVTIHDKQTVNKHTSVDFTASGAGCISIKPMVLGFMCQGLLQIHPVYSHCSDRKKSPSPPLSKTDPSPTADTCVLFNCVTSPFPSYLCNRALPSLRERSLHATALLTSLWGGCGEKHLAVG